MNNASSSLFHRSWQPGTNSTISKRGSWEVYDKSLRLFLFFLNSFSLFFKCPGAKASFLKLFPCCAHIYRDVFVDVQTIGGAREAIHPANAIEGVV